MLNPREGDLYIGLEAVTSLGTGGFGDSRCDDKI